MLVNKNNAVCLQAESGGYVSPLFESAAERTGEKYMIPLERYVTFFYQFHVDFFWDP